MSMYFIFIKFKINGDFLVIPAKCYMIFFRRVCNYIYVAPIVPAEKKNTLNPQYIQNCFPEIQTPVLKYIFKLQKTFK